MAAEETRTVGDLLGVDTSDVIDVFVTPGNADELFVACDQNLLPYLETQVQGDVLQVAWQNGIVGLPKTDRFVEVHRLDLETLGVSGSADVRADGTLPALRSANVSGSGSISVAGSDWGSDWGGDSGGDSGAEGLLDGILLASDLDLNVSGSGDIAVRGIDTDGVQASISGSGSVDLQGVANQVIVDVSGSGDADLTQVPAAGADLDVSGSGNLAVSASESVRVRISGSGNVTVYGNPTDLDVDTSGTGQVDSL